MIDTVKNSVHYTEDVVRNMRRDVSFCVDALQELLDKEEKKIENEVIANYLKKNTFEKITQDYNRYNNIVEKVKTDVPEEEIGECESPEEILERIKHNSQLISTLGHLKRNSEYEDDLERSYQERLADRNAKVIHVRDNRSMADILKL